MSVTDLDKHFCEHITGIRRFFEVVMAKLGISFCMYCFQEKPTKAFPVKDVLQRDRTIYLCKDCEHLVDKIVW